MENNEAIDVPKQVLKRFAVNGYHKTSMQEIALTLAVSRQAVYNRFKSKERCYHWALHSYLSAMYSEIFSLLSGNDCEARATLNRVFYILVVESVEVIENTHGKQVFDDAMALNNRASEDWNVRLHGRLADFIFRQRLTQSLQQAHNMAFVLISAAKGVLLESDSKAKSVAGIDIILSTVLFGSDVSSLV